MAFGHQFVVVADLDDTAAVEDDQAVGVAQASTGGARWRWWCGRARGCRAPSGFPSRSSCRPTTVAFVEDQDLRVDEQGAGDRDALAFAAGQRLAAFADQES